ncbi:hypothetical protein D3C86_1967630 [compost metagenome]
MIFSSSPLSDICFRPLAAMMASASPPCSPAHMAGNTSFLAVLFDTVPSAMRASSLASCAGVTGAASMAMPSRFSCEATSPISQLAAGLALAAPASATTAS